MKDVIGKKLKHLRFVRGWTQEDVSAKVNWEISRSTISNYEIGRRMPHLSDLQKLAEVFGVGLDYFEINPKDEAFDVLARAKEVFQSKDISEETKERLYQEFMRLYLTMKGE